MLKTYMQFISIGTYYIQSVLFKDNMTTTERSTIAQRISGTDNSSIVTR